MREIKFRAWDRNENKMLNHYDLYAMDCSTDYPFLALIKGYYALSGARFLDGVDPVTMQYTGIKDKNGKEIYEGDIVQADSEYGDVLTGKIFYKNGCFRLREHTLDKIYNVEVIGNIYENPEMLGRERGD